jgi:hypothetical protein
MPLSSFGDDATFKHLAEAMNAKATVDGIVTISNVFGRVP